MTNNFDEYTLGNSPAAIYIIDLLNNIDRKKAIHIIKSYSEFKESFREVMDAHAEGVLSAKVVRKYIELYRSNIPTIHQNLVSKEYDIKIINLYENLLIAEFKKSIRKLDSIKRIETSAVSRAKSQLKKSGKVYHHEQMNTYGKYEGDNIPVAVKFNEYGLALPCVNVNLIQDKITSETLMEKSLKRMERRNK